MASLTIDRRILGFDPDADGSWIARLDCGHRRHVRHRPPLSSFPWVDDPAERDARIGQPIECDRCLRLELPTTATVYRTTDTWDEHTIPAALRHDHTLRAGVWARIEVLDGRLRYRIAPPIDRDLVIEAGAQAIVPPEVPHSVEPLGPVRFRIAFMRP